MEKEKRSPGAGHRKFAELLDQQFTIPKTGIRFGLDPILGLVPVAGDWLAGVASLYYLLLGALRGAQSYILIRIFINIVLDILIGSIPLLGDVFDISWKANIRNSKILEEFESRPESTESESKVRVWGVFIVLTGLIFGLLFLLTWAIAEFIGLIF